MLKKNMLLVINLFVISAVFLNSCSSEPSEESNESENDWKSTYEVATEGNRIKDIIGVALGDVASEIKSQAHFDISSNGKFNWLVAEVSIEEFKRLTEQLELEHKPDLLTFWPEALDCEIEEFKANWKVEKKVDEYTYYSEKPGNATQSVFKYANGKIYIKKLTKYITTSMDGEIVHKKAISQNS